MCIAKNGVKGMVFFLARNPIYMTNAAKYTSFGRLL
jgi:hypothetical protein